MHSTSLSSPFLVIYSFFGPTLVLVVPLILFCLSNEHKAFQNVIIILLIHAFMNVILISLFKNAFQLVVCSEYGIKNICLNLKWEDINHISIINFKLFEWSIFPTITIKLISISSQEAPSSFLKCNPNQHILLPLSKKSINMLSFYSNNNSCVISDFISHN